jgi:prevent-host-death family protein
MEDPNHKGNVAETAIAAAAIKLGIDVLRPMVEHTRYDLIFDVNDQLLRIQCKWAPLKGDVIHVNLTSSRYTSGGRLIRRSYDANEIDAVGVYCEDLDRCYLLPINRVAGMRAMHLRVGAPRNGQRAQLNWAADHHLQGAIAQLGERRDGIAKGVGSSPTGSTQRAEPEAVGAHVFRNHFGWYMERAHAGERFLVTRRGKPYVRLIPANDQRGMAQ